MNYSRILQQIAVITGGLALLSSCSNEEREHNFGGQVIDMTVDLSRGEGDNDTRSLLEEYNGDLKATWENNDRVLVTDADGNKMGVLSLYKMGNSRKKATFTGKITVSKTGVQTVNFMYLGRNKSEEDLLSLSNPVSIDYSNQDGTIEWLYNHDFFTSSQSVDLSSGAVNVSDVKLSRKIAFARFELKFDEGTVYHGDPIEITGAGVYNTASISMHNEVTMSGDKITVIPTTRVTEGHIMSRPSADFYVAVLPKPEPSKGVNPQSGDYFTEDIDMNFATKINGVSYAGNPGVRQWTPSEFVRLNFGGNEYDGVPVEMKYYLVEQPDEWIDLDLPSGNLWRKMNLGATSVSDPGYYVGWGDKTATMTSTEAEDYPMFSPQDNSGYTTKLWDLTGTNILSYVYIVDIQKNRSYDTAYYMTNGECWMPNREDFFELYKNTTIEFVEVDGKECVQLTSVNNENFILIPRGGVMIGNEKVNDGYMLSLWTSYAQYIANNVELYEDIYGNQSYVRTGPTDQAVVFTDTNDLYGGYIVAYEGCLALSEKSNRANIRPIKK